MKKAKMLAAQLGKEFMRIGNYVGQQSALGDEVEELIDIPSFDDANKTVASKIASMGIEIQCLGHFDGGDDEEDKIVLYTKNYIGKARSKSIPKIDGVPIKTEHVGSLLVKPKLASSEQKEGKIYIREEKLCCGSSCAPAAQDYSGTLGALIRKNDDPENVYILSNNHILSGCNQIPKGMPILSPSSKDGRPEAFPPTTISFLSEIDPLEFGDPGFITPCENDVAIAKLRTPDILSSWQGDPTYGFDTPDGVVEPESRMRVKKFGRTSGLTFGSVLSPIEQISLNFAINELSVKIWFQNVWMVKGINGGTFAKEGDSGSLVVTDNGTDAVGLLFACSNTKQGGSFGLIIPISRVLDLFGGLSLVTDYGL